MGPLLTFTNHLLLYIVCIVNQFGFQNQFYNVLDGAREPYEYHVSEECFTRLVGLA